MEPIRVLQVLGRLDRGGAETMIMNIYRNIDRSLVQFDFVIHTEDECDYSAEVGSLGANIYSMERFTFRTAFSYRRRWRKFFEEHPDYRVIHGHMRSTASIYLDEAKKAGLYTIAHSHNTSSGHGISAIVKNILQGSISDRADMLLACSMSAGRWLYGVECVSTDRFKVLPNAIDTVKFRYTREAGERIRRELKISPTARVLLHVGRFESQKNQVFLLKIFREITSMTRREVHLLLCGEGPMRGFIEDFAKKLGLSGRVHFLGIRTDIPDIMCACDLMVFPSLFEGLPVTVIEAQSTGLMTLMSDTITDEVMLTELVEPLSLALPAQVWASAVLAAIEKPARRERENAWQKISKTDYNVENTAKYLSKFYLSVSKNSH